VPTTLWGASGSANSSGQTPSAGVETIARTIIVVSKLAVIHFTDPACPFAYSASPAMAVLRWRYGDQLDWRVVTIGLTEDPQRYIDAGYTTTRMVLGHLHAFARHGMPFLYEPRARIAASTRACRAIVAARLLAPGREHDVLRALQLGWFTTTLVLDEDADIAKALARVQGLDADAIVGAIDDERTLAAYEQDKTETRSAQGMPIDFQGKARQTDGPVRYSAPSLIFESESGQRLQAGGFQPLEAYDVLIANLDRTLERRDPPDGPLDALRAFPEGLVTQEVAAILAHNNQLPDRTAAESALIELLGDGAVRRTSVGDGALWQIA
jgi:protein-disulfide isomerase-like protein with CxxC motif